MKQISRIMKLVIAISVFYYIVIIGGLYLLNSVLADDYTLLFTSFMLCIFTIPSIGNVLLCATIILIVKQYFTILNREIGRTVASNVSYRKVFTCLNFVSRLFRLRIVFLTYFTGPFMMFSLFCILVSSLQCFELIQLMIRTNRITLAEQIHMSTTTLWLLSLLCQFVIGILVIGRTDAQANETALCTRHFDDYTMKNTKVAKQINKFLLKNLHQKKKFSAYGFFDIDNSVIYTVFSSIITYLVILIQFKQLESDLTQNDRNRTVAGGT
ncbi:gustatory receptor 68a [Malaya genurostris]|uniref:gustatory receptor 68a n=1 Tax=Malaya genurostris TaxID=325434 RepID=UPI0026F3D640|nr:gustatory receptor 68a [Malaya genurostris]